MQMQDEDFRDEGAAARSYDAEKARDEAMRKAEEDILTAYDHLVVGRLAEALADAENAVRLIKEAMDQHSQTPVVRTTSPPEERRGR